MSPLCPIVREGLADYLGERLPAPQRRILREHLAVCAECRNTAAAEDASLVFARPTTAEDVAPEEVASILASVRTGVAHIEAERRIGASRPSRKRAARVAAAAAVTLLALTIPAGSRRDTRVASAPTASPVPTRAAAGPAAAGMAEAALPQEAVAPADGATVYELNPGAGREEPRVVWIVDRGLDI
ncbi:MAG TPA: zf-HC2 domain-containing protein [Thermoanaerobaculia bacterium]|nr:zf-HC2 domain-containing protein [Thermoanaerobaculia bacterium]